MKKFILSMGVFAMMASMTACGTKTNENETEDTVEVAEVVVDTVAVDTVNCVSDSLPTEAVAE